MAQRDETSVPKAQRPTEQEFHARMIAGLARAAVRLGGQGALADKMDITPKGLEKIFKGGATHPKRLFDLLDHDPHVLDDIANGYGVRIVDKEAVCDRDDASVLVARLMLWLQEAQHPDSPGGRNIVHTELLPAELLIRQLHGATGNWLARISDMKNAA